MSTDGPLYMRRTGGGELRRAGTPRRDIPRYPEPSGGAGLVGMCRFLALYASVWIYRGRAFSLDNGCTTRCMLVNLAKEI